VAAWDARAAGHDVASRDCQRHDHQERVLVRFEGVDTIDAAEALGKAELRVSADTLAALPEGTYHHHDRVGCEVVAVDGTAIGVVEGVAGHRVASHLVVHGRRGEVLVPLAESICVGFDLEAAHHGRAAEGLLDLN
jgi:16S rRNA processing protein RimM